MNQDNRDSRFLGRKPRALAHGVLLLALLVTASGCQLANRLHLKRPSFPNPIKREEPKKEVPKDITLTYWGLWEPEEVLRPLIEQYQSLYSQKNPGSTIKIEYLRKPPSQYRETLQSSIRSGQGPDLFRFHNTWVPMLREELAPIPQTVMSNADYEATFYPITKSDLLVGNSYVGFPLMFEGLALFYNEDLFRQEGVTTPPTSWDELRKLALKLTKPGSKPGEIQIAGVALGTANNVDHFSDIVGLMMLQNQADMRDISTTNAQDAIRYYTIFAVEDGSWNETMLPSTAAFANGKAAMFFAPSWRVANLKEANASLKFRTAPVPQLPGSNVTWGSYWVEGVSDSSLYQIEAWEFLKFLTQKETLRRMYTDAAKITNRLFGEPYPRRDMAESLLEEPYVGPFIQGATTAKSWYFASRTFDNGLNDRLIKTLEDAVSQINRGGPYTDDKAYVAAVDRVLKQAQQNAANVLTQYNIQVPGVTPQ